MELLTNFPYICQVLSRSMQSIFGASERIVYILCLDRFISGLRNDCSTNIEVLNTKAIAMRFVVSHQPPSSNLLISKFNSLLIIVSGYLPNVL